MVGGRGREAVQERGFGVSHELVLLSATGEEGEATNLLQMPQAQSVELE